MTPVGLDAGLATQIALRQDAIDRIKKILIENLHVGFAPDAIDLDVALFATGLALDSVDALELVVAVEADFGVTFSQDDLRSSLRTLNTLVDLVLSSASAQEGGA